MAINCNGIGKVSGIKRCWFHQYKEYAVIMPNMQETDNHL